MEFEIPPKIGVLLLMAKLPPSMENIAQELNRDDDFGDTTFEEVRRMILLSLGAKGHLPGGYIEDTLRFFKQFTQKVSRGYMLGSFTMYPPL